MINTTNPCVETDQGQTVMNKLKTGMGGEYLTSLTSDSEECWY
jgi:hypothetical protein